MKKTQLIFLFGLISFGVQAQDLHFSQVDQIPMMLNPIRADRDAATLGYAGVYSSFLLFAKRAEAKYGVSAREILLELGRRGTVGGQEDMIVDVALDLLKAQEHERIHAQPVMSEAG